MPLSRNHRLGKYYAMKTYWGAEVQLHEFLTLALDGGKMSASLPGWFTPPPGTESPVPPG
jgi:hypothetical protein